MRLSPLIFVLFLSASASWAGGPLCSELFSEEAPKSPTGLTQTQLVKKGLLQYVPRLLNNFRENLSHITGFSDYALFEKIHKDDPQGSVFRMFEKNAFRNKPAQAWSFPFYNRPEFFTDILKHEFGFCSGITSSLRKFNMLATFQKDVMDSIPDRRTQPKEWLEYYTSQIENIMNNKMTTIQGFEDLYTFSSDPEIQKYIREKIVDQWQKNNVNLIQGTLDGFLSVRQSMNKSDLANLHHELSQKMDYGYNPIVYLSQKSKKFFSTKQWIHVVMVTEVSKIEVDGSYQVKVWDINREAKSATRTIKISPEGEMVMGEKTLNMIKILRWDDLEIERIIKKNVDHCLTNTCAVHKEETTQDLSPASPR
jgi:hypothetical protein